MNNYFWEEEVYAGDVKFHLSYCSQYKSYRDERTIYVDSSYVDRMREFLDDLGFEKVVEDEE